MYFDNFLEKLQEGDLAKAILLFGESESVIYEGLEVIKKKFKKTQSVGTIQIFDGAEHILRDMVSSAQSTGLFSTSQLLIFKNAQKILGGHSESTLEELKDYFKNPSPDSTLVFLAVGMKKTAKAVTTLERFGWGVQCSDMPEWKLVPWVKKQAADRGLSIADQGIQWFIQKVGNDVAYLRQGLDQLVDYCYPEKKVTLNHLKELAVPGTESDIFPFLDAVALRQTEKAFKLMGELQDGIGTGTLLSLYGRMRELLWVSAGKSSGIKQDQFQEQLGLHPFRLKILLEQSNQFTIDELKEAMKDLIHLQAGVVTGRVGKQSAAVSLEWWLLKWGKTKLALRS